jgi:restriction system protein
VLLTTATFSRDAREYVERTEKRVILVDGGQLAALMFDVGLGVTRVETYDVKRIDSDFFES